MRCPQGGLGQVLAEIFVKGERLRSMTVEELVSTSGRFLLDFIGSCILSWANGAVGRAAGTFLWHTACLKWMYLPQTKIHDHIQNFPFQLKYTSSINTPYNSVNILNRLCVGCRRKLHSIPYRGKKYSSVALTATLGIT
jgi:hypothetical protein